MKNNLKRALVGLLLASAATVARSPDALAQQGPDRHPVKIAILGDLHVDGASGVVIREPGQPDVIAMSDESASAETLLEMLALLRAVWDKDGVDAPAAATYRLRSNASQSMRGSRAERLYARRAIDRVLAAQDREIPGVGRGRVLTARVARTASGG